MDSQERKKVNVATKYAIEAFSGNDWHSLGQLTGGLNIVQNHPRLLRSLSFGDDDYPSCAAEVLNEIFKKNPAAIDDVVDYFDIDVWFEQKDPARYRKVFFGSAIKSPDFWVDGCLKAFISHLSQSKAQVSLLKRYLGQWGISAFIAHEDIEPSREWQKEIEAALETMDVMIAVLQPGFKDSDWCCQEVGYALGRKVEIIPLRAGLDPLGFIGKIQGVQIKNKLPLQAAEEVACLLLRKPKYRNQILLGLSMSITAIPSNDKIEKIRLVDSWEAATEEQLRTLLERVSLSDHEKSEIGDIIGKVKAFESGFGESAGTEGIPF